MLHRFIRTVFSAIMLLALMVFAPVAFGQSTPTTYQIDVPITNQVTTNQCSSAGEPVSLNGNMHADMTFTTDSSGVNHFSITVSNNLNGSGQNSGLSYTAQDSNSYTINTGGAAGDITVEFRSDLTPVGGGASMTLIQNLHLNADTTGNLGLEVKDNSTQCGS
jgi:hypothetical protein